MQLSKKCDYALRAMVELAASYARNQPLSTRELSEKEGVPLQFLEQILHTLKRAGFVKSQLGAKGGYTLARSPADITFGQVMRVMEGTLAPIGCVDECRPEQCPQVSHCKFHRVMEELQAAVIAVVDHRTLADVAG